MNQIRKWKKGCASILLACMLCMILAPAAWADTTPYKDVNYATEQGKAIQKMTEAGIVGGYEDGMFRPEGKLTRAEFVKIVNGVFRYLPNDKDVRLFDDVKSHWAYGEIVIAQQAGYIGGVGYVQGVGNHCFAPNATLTREQVAVILSRILKLDNIFQMKLTLQDEVSAWARADVEKAIVCGVFKLEDNNTFRATQPITRAEVCQVLAPYIQKAPLLTPEAKNVHRALKEAAIALQGLSYNDASMNKIVLNLKTCITKALNANWQGTTITREYVDTTYKDQIDETRRLYRALSEEKREQFKYDIVNRMSLDSISVLYDYFLGD